MKHSIVSIPALLVFFIFVLPAVSTAQADTLAVYFQFNDATIRKEASSLINKFSASHGAAVKFIILGYTDSLGSNSYNNRLSNTRANNVQAHLIASGLNRSKIALCIGKGEINTMGGIVSGDKDNRKVLLIADPLSENKSHTISSPVIMQKMPAPFTPFTNLTQYDTGTTFVLNNITFDPSDDHLKPDAKPQLDDLYSAMALNPRLKIRIEGHICCPGTLIKYDNLFSGAIDDMVTPDTSHSPNTETLSLGRAKAVYNYLIKNGIDSSRITCEGFGTTRPLVPETSEKNAQKNRRIEFRIVEK